MKRLLYAATAICGLALPASAAPIDGDINFDGNVVYTSSTVDFLGNEGVSSSTGALATFGTYNGCITGISITYPLGGTVTNFLSGSNAGVTFALDLLSTVNIQFVSR